VARGGVSRMNVLPGKRHRWPSRRSPLRTALVVLVVLILGPLSWIAIGSPVPPGTVGGTGAGPLARALPRVVGNLTAGYGAIAMALDPVSGDIFVANAGSVNVTVIDGSTDSVVGSFPEASGVCSLVYDPDNNDLYAVNVWNNNVSVVNATTFSRVATIKTYLSSALAVDPRSGDVYVANANGTVAVVNGTSNRARGWVHVGGDPDGVAYEPRSDEIFVTNLTGTVVTAINGTNRSVAARIDVGRPSATIAYDPASDWIVTSAAGYYAVGYASAPSLHLINGSSNIQFRHPYVGPSGPSSGVGRIVSGPSLNPSNGDVFVTTDADQYFVVSGRTGRVIGTGGTGYAPGDPIFDSRTGYILVPNAGSSNLTILSSFSRAIVGSLAVPGSPFTGLYDPLNGEVYLIDAARIGSYSPITIVR